MGSFDFALERVWTERGCQRGTREHYLTRRSRPSSRGVARAGWRSDRKLDRPPRHPTYHSIGRVSAPNLRMSAVGATAASAVRGASRAAPRARRAAPRAPRPSFAAPLSAVPRHHPRFFQLHQSDDVSSWEEIDTQVAVMCSKFAGDSSVNPRIFAVTELGPDKTYEALDDITVVDVYQAAYDGGLEECTTIIDVHLRPCASASSRRASTSSTPSTISSAACPMLQKSSLIATAAVAEAGLLQVKEEYDLVGSILRDDATAKGVADEIRLEYEKTKVILEWIDKVIAAIHEEKGVWTVSWSAEPQVRGAILDLPRGHPGVRDFEEPRLPQPVVKISPRPQRIAYSSRETRAMLTRVMSRRVHNMNTITRWTTRVFSPRRALSTVRFDARKSSLDVRARRAVHERGEGKDEEEQSARDGDEPLRDFECDDSSAHDREPGAERVPEDPPRCDPERVLVRRQRDGGDLRSIPPTRPET